MDREKIYAPNRNPHYNESNYRISVSLPAWHEANRASATTQ
jgi:hypothetical protein